MGILASLGRRNRIARTVLLAPAGYPQPLNFWIRAQGLPLFNALARMLPKEFLARLILKDSMGDFTLLSREVIDDVVAILRSKWGMRAFMYLCRNIIRLCRDARNGKNNILSSLVPKFRHATARRPDGGRGPVDVLLIYGEPRQQGPHLGSSAHRGGGVERARDPDPRHGAPAAAGAAKPRRTRHRRVRQAEPVPAFGLTGVRVSRGDSIARDPRTSEPATSKPMIAHIVGSYSKLRYRPQKSISNHAMNRRR